jgi:hypothetical protein
MSKLEGIFKAVELKAHNHIEHWIFNSNYPLEKSERINLYKRFNEKYYNKHTTDYVSYQNQFRIKYYHSYTKIFDRYVKFYQYIKEK